MRAVCVRVTRRDPQQALAAGWPSRLHQDGSTWVGASGCVLPTVGHSSAAAEESLVVTTATLFVPFLSSSVSSPFSASSASGSSLLPAGILAPGVRVEVLLPSATSSERADDAWREARLEGMYSAKEAVAALLQLTGGSDQLAWGIGWRETGQPVTNDWNPQAAVSIAVIRLLPRNQSHASPTPTLSPATLFDELQAKIPWAPAATLSQGDALRLYGSPYGLLAPHVFFNCLSTGIVSGRLEVLPIPDFSSTLSSSSTAPSHPLLLTDARCIPGSEGGPVFDENSKYVGITLPPLFLRNGSPVELNLVITADVVLSLIKQHLMRVSTIGGGVQSRSILPIRPMPSEDRRSAEPSAAVKRAQRSIVLIEVGNSWASGIVLSSSGFILTNAHVVRPYLITTEDSVMQLGISIRVRVDDPRQATGFSWHKADLLFASSSCIDVALLQLRSAKEITTLVPATFAPQTPRVGESVFVIGYPLFFPTIGQSSVCTSGKVSKVVTTSDGTAAVIQTTAAVHNGNSGGALINNGGKVIGMVTCNMRRKGVEDDASGVIIPRLNFSIPVNLLAPVFSFVRTNPTTEPRAALASLNQASRELEEVWKLQRLSAFPALPPESKFGRFVRDFAPDPRSSTTTVPVVSDNVAAPDSASTARESPNAQRRAPFASAL